MVKLTTVIVLFGITIHERGGKTERSTLTRTCPLNGGFFVGIQWHRA